MQSLTLSNLFLRLSVCLLGKSEWCSEKVFLADSMSLCSLWHLTFFPGFSGCSSWVEPLCCVWRFVIYHCNKKRGKSEEKEKQRRVVILTRQKWNLCAIHSVNFLIFELGKKKTKHLVISKYNY